MSRTGIGGSAHLVGILLLLAWAVVACGDRVTVVTPTSDIATVTPAPPVEPTLTEVPPPEPTATPSEPSFQMRVVLVVRDAEGNLREMQADDKLHACLDPAAGCPEVYGLSFVADEDVYAYAFQVDEGDNVYVLFPNPDFSDQSNPVSNNTRVWVPKDYAWWFWLAPPHPDGAMKETIHLVASQEPIEALERAVSFFASPGGDEGEASSLVQLFLAGRGPGGITQVEDPIFGPDGNIIDLPQIIADSTSDEKGWEGVYYSMDFMNVHPEAPDAGY